MIFAEALKVLYPKQKLPSRDWFVDYIQTPDQRPYDAERYPHTTAPGGPCDALDDDHVREIWLQWGSRLGKTFFGQCALLRQADLDPCTMFFVGESQKTATEVVARTYKMIAHCPRLRDQLRPEFRRKQDLIDLANCRVHVGWARSVSTLADKGVKVGHANEIDKWEHQTTSKEADPLKLFDDRFKEFPDHKKIKESTPNLKGSSRVERGRLSSTNCSYFVPCPHCKKYQVLVFGNTKEAGGIVWDKLGNGRSDKDLAWKTARYVCKFCQKDILDEHRGEMMRSGVWVPEGCDVRHVAARNVVKGEYEWHGWDKAKWVKGSPVRDGRSAGYMLSSLYAVSLMWGDIAAEFVECKDKVQNLRNFVNQWLGETWESIERRQTWEQLAARLIVQTPEGVIPDWASMLTCGVDRQQDFFVYVVDAWGPDRTSHTIRYGQVDTLDQLREQIESYYHYEDGESIYPAMTFIDSGYRPQGVYEFCVECNKRKHMVWPCKGSSKAQDTDVRHNRLGPNSSMPGMLLFHVDSIRTQSWLDHCLHSKHAGDPGATTVYHGSKFEHQDFIEQLLNEAAVLKLDTTNHEREIYERIDTGVPNDYRDCRRYSYAAMIAATRGRPIRPRGGTVEKRKTVINAGAVRPDGRAW